MGEANTKVRIGTKKITARNLHKAIWEIPYCSTCEDKDKTRPLRFGWFKSFFETFTECVHGVEYLKLDRSVHFFRFENKEYLDLFLSLNSDKRQSEVVQK
jgi:hypothetical protein